MWNIHLLNFFSLIFFYFKVARILGINNRVVKNQIMTLLWDSMEEVLMGVVPHLGRTIDLLIGSGVLGQEQVHKIIEIYPLIFF